MLSIVKENIFLKPVITSNIQMNIKLIIEEMIKFSSSAYLEVSCMYSTFQCKIRFEDICKTKTWFRCL